MAETYRVTVLLDVNDVQNVDDRAESRSYVVADRHKLSYQGREAGGVDAVVVRDQDAHRLPSTAGH